MKRVSSRIDQIRDFFVYQKGEIEFLKGDEDSNVIFVALDTIEDTVEALQHFEGKGFGKTTGEKYLTLYGVLQAVIIQQDALDAIHKIVLGQPLSPGHAWQEIRDIRVLVAGHPVESRWLRKRSGISRVTIEDYGFQLVLRVIDKKKEEYKTIAFRLLYDSYKDEAVSVLDRVLTALQK